jgi:beta-lactamase class A
MNQQNKKEAVKGRKSIMPFIALILFLVLCATYFFYIPHMRNDIDRFKEMYSFLNPSAALLSKESLIVNFQPLRESLIKKYETTKGDYLVSLYFEYFPTGANININKDEAMWPASLIKIPVAMTALKKVQDGKWKLNNELVILDEDKDKSFGELYREPTGTTFSIERFLRESLVNSDNTAHFVLLRNLDPEEVEDTYAHLGLEDALETLKENPNAKEGDNRITAKRYSIFFRSLYNATYLTPEYSQFFLNILKAAPKEYISQGIPPYVTFVHKTGVRVDEGVWADAGIVYTPERPYLLTVMIQSKNGNANAEEGAKKIFKEISEEIYHYVSTAK